MPNKNLTKIQRIKSILAASSGNFIEWFDFYMYIALASYFTHHFFVSSDENVALIQTYGVFALGFFMRPIGSFFFGSLADKIGRKKTLIYSIVLMSLGNFMIALLPSHQSIGIWAPILLMVARMIQGISVGAEGGIVATYIAEISTKGNRGFYSSFQYVTLIMAQFFALGCVWIFVSITGEEILRDYGWRILFTFAGVLALGSLFLRSGMHESAQQIHEHDNKKTKKGSLKVLWHYKKYSLLVFGLTASGSMCYYNFTAYMKTYLSKSAGFDSNTAYLIAMCALAFGMIIQPFMGMLGDKIGTKKMLTIYSVVGFLSVFPLMFGIIEAGPNGRLNSPLIAFLLIACGLVITAFYSSIAGIAKASLFPEHVRALGTGLPYAMAVAIFGGTVPSIALWFQSGGVIGEHRLGLPEWGYFIYIMFFLACCLWIAFNIPQKTELEKQYDS